MKTTTATKGKTITQPATGRRYEVLTKVPQVMGHHAGDPADPAVMVMVRPAAGGRAFDLFFNQADLDAGRYVIES